MEITTSKAVQSVDSDGYSIFDDVSHETTSTKTPSWEHVTDDARLRSDGVLTPDELAYCRQNAIATAYDPVQFGWVPAHVVDDISDDAPGTAGTRMGQWNPGDSAKAKVERMFARELKRLGSEGLADGVDEAWLYATHLVRTMTVEQPAKRRLTLLRRLQAEAVSTLRPVHSQLPPPESMHLRAWTNDDLETYRALLDNPRVWRYLPEPYPAPLTSSLAADLIRVSNDAEHHCVRAIQYHGSLVGQVRLLFSPDDRSEAEISYWIGEAHWGQGIASRVIPMFSASSFAEHPELKSIYAKIHKDNAASSVVVMRAGYRNEGTLASELAGDPDTQIFRLFR